MNNAQKDKEEAQKPKKAYVKPMISTEPLCSDMALCGCDPSEAKLDWECEMNGYLIGPT